MTQARIQVQDAAGRRVVMISKERFAIGRRGDNDLVLPQPEVSREHAEIVAHEGGYLVRDLGSRVGTWVNGARVTERPLDHGDRLRFGGESQPEHLFLLDAATVTQRPTVAAAGELRQVAALLEGLRALGSGRVLEEVLGLVLDSTLELSGAERGFIMLAGAKGALEFKLGRARGRVTLAGSEFDTSRRIPEEVFATGEARLVSDMLDADLAEMHQHTIAHGIRTVFAIPLRLVRLADEAPATSGAAAAPDAARTTIGVLYLDSRQTGPLLSGTMRSALETLATEAAVAIENARLYRESLEKARIEEELRIAGQIQQALLPPRTHEGAYFRAAGASIPCQAIGGDLFDYLDLPEERAGFALGDVAGKGPSAALLAGVVQGMFYSVATSAEGPAATLARMNRALTVRPITARFATVAYVVLSPDGRLASCNGGHNPPMIVRATGAVESLRTGGLILGVFPQAEYEEEIVTLNPGDTLLLYSDGLTEATADEDEEFGEERLVAWLGAHPALEPSTMVDQLMADVRTFAGGRPQADDMTALAVRYLGPA